MPIRTGVPLGESCAGPGAGPVAHPGPAAFQALATVFEEAIREHPEDWHMLQKVFVSDLEPGRLARSRARAVAGNGNGADQ